MEDLHSVDPDHSSTPSIEDQSLVDALIAPTPNHLQVPAAQPPNPPNSPWVPPQIPAPNPPPLPVRCSNRIPKPTEAVLRSQMYEEREEQARLADKDWAKDTHPTANFIDGDPFPFDDERFDSPYACLTEPAPVKVPRTYNEAMKESEKWYPAMRKEMDQMEKRSVWKLVDKPKDAKVVSGMWVYSHKFDGEGKVIGWKARWVVRDDMVDSDGVKTWAMVSRAESV